jgi:peptidoglycan/xylan/chitin deacetylase (PgdA/CDA1 family)
MRVPILCYHRVEVPPRGAEADANFVTPAQFTSQMQYLAERGFTAVTVRDIARWQRGEHTLPTRPVAITFDDAYDSVTEHAVPCLDTLHWPCTIFAVSSQLGGTNAWDARAPRTTLMSATTLRQLATAQHEIGSHSRHHVRIRGLTSAVATEELAGARHDLESQLGAPVESFAFPYGSHDPAALKHVGFAGYRAACTLKRWANPARGNPLRLGRMSVGGPLSLWQFEFKLRKVQLTPAWV